MPAPNVKSEDAQDPAEAVRAKLDAWKLTLRDDLNYRLDLMFPRLEGWGAKNAISQKVKLIQRLEPLLENMLREGEEIRYIARGVRNSFSQSFFMGHLWANLINQRAIVLTSARLIVMTINTRGTPKEPLWMTYYSEIQTFKGNWIGNVQLKLKDRTNIMFSGFSKLDRKHMPLVFEQAIEEYRQAGFQPEVTQSLECLCTRCYARVPKGEYVCPECGAEFWEPRDVALRSLLIPSWGDFVLGHTLLAVFELLGFLVVWGVFVMLLVAALSNPPKVDFTVVAGHFVFMLIGHVIDAVLTHSIASSGLHFRRASQGATSSDRPDDDDSDAPL